MFTPTLESAQEDFRHCRLQRCATRLWRCLTTIPTVPSAGPLGITRPMLQRW